MLLKGLFKPIQEKSKLGRRFDRSVHAEIDHISNVYICILAFNANGSSEQGKSDG